MYKIYFNVAPHGVLLRDESSLVKFDWTYSATTSLDNMKNEFKQRANSY